MPFTSQDLDNIDAAIASGKLHVQFSDGRSVTYRSIDDLGKAKAEIKKDLLIASGNPPVRRIRVYTTKDF